MQSLPSYTQCLFPMILNDNIVDIEKADELCSPTVVHGFLRVIFTFVNLFY